jgi:hypothetical protein
VAPLAGVLGFDLTWSFVSCLSRPDPLHVLALEPIVPTANQAVNGLVNRICSLKQIKPASRIIPHEQSSCNSGNVLPRHSCLHVSIIDKIYIAHRKIRTSPSRSLPQHHFARRRLIRQSARPQIDTLEHLITRIHALLRQYLEVFICLDFGQEIVVQDLVVDFVGGRFVF